MKELILNLDKKVFKLMMIIGNISFFISLIGILGLYIFLKFYIDIKLYYVSIIIFQASLTAAISAFCFGLFFDRQIH